MHRMGAVFCQRKMPFCTKITRQTGILLRLCALNKSINFLRTRRRRFPNFAASLYSLQHFRKQHKTALLCLITQEGHPYLCPMNHSLNRKLPSVRLYAD